MRQAAVCAGALLHWQSLLHELQRVRRALVKLLFRSAIRSLRRHVAGWEAAAVEAKCRRHVLDICRLRNQHRVSRLLHAHLSQWRAEQVASTQARRYRHALLQWSATQANTVLKIVGRRRGRELVVEAGGRRAARETVVFEGWLLVVKRARALASRYLSVAVAREGGLVMSAFRDWVHLTERGRGLRRREWSSVRRRCFCMQAASFSCWLARFWRRQRLVRLVGARVALSERSLLRGCLLEWLALAQAKVRRMMYQVVTVCLRTLCARAVCVCHNTQTHTHTHTRTHTHTHNIYMYIYMYTHTHTHTHTRMRKQTHNI